MASPGNTIVEISTPNTTLPKNPSSPLLQITPEMHLAIFETLDEGTSMLLGLTCKYFYKIHREFHKSPTSLLTGIDNEDGPLPRFLLINYLVDWLPNDSNGDSITLAPPINKASGGVLLRASKKVCIVGKKKVREEYRDFRPKTLPRLPRFLHVEISLLVPRESRPTGPPLWSPRFSTWFLHG